MGNGVSSGEGVRVMKKGASQPVRADPPAKIVLIKK